LWSIDIDSKGACRHSTSAVTSPDEKISPQRQGER
jgi:hypothetical protein